jgi:hypothetical protein
VFVKRDAQWEWCGEGSVRSRDASVRVLALDEGRCITVDGACESVGSAPDLQRSLYQVTGAVEWQHPELGICQIRCASQDASVDFDGRSKAIPSERILKVEFPVYSL